MKQHTQLRIMTEALQLLTELHADRTTPDVLAKAYEFEKRSSAHKRCMDSFLALMLDMECADLPSPLTLSRIETDMALGDDLYALGERLARRLLPILESDPMPPVRQVAMFVVIMQLVTHAPLREEQWALIDTVFTKCTAAPDYPQADAISKHLRAFREAAWSVVPETSALRHA